MVANSNAMNNIAPGTNIRYTLAPWEIGYMVADGIAALFFLWVVGMIIYRLNDEKKNPDKYK